MVCVCVRVCVFIWSQVEWRAFHPLPLRTPSHGARTHGRLHSCDMPREHAPAAGVQRFTDAHALLPFPSLPSLPFLSSLGRPLSFPSLRFAR